MGNSGQATLDFLFATVLVTGTAALICALTMALTLIEVAQYVSFSGARSYMAADKNISMQRQAADQQIESLKKLPFLSASTSNGWIVIKPRGAKDYSDYAQSKGVTLDHRNQFTGYQMEVALPLLKIKIPLMGNIMSSSDDEDVTVTISSFLMRDPTFDECVSFNNQVWQALVNRSGNYQKAQGASFTAAVNDNGC